MTGYRLVSQNLINRFLHIFGKGRQNWGELLLVGRNNRHPLRIKQTRRPGIKRDRRMRWTMARVMLSWAGIFFPSFTPQPSSAVFLLCKRGKIPFTKESRSYAWHCMLLQHNIVIIRTYAEEENCEAIFRRSGSEFIILQMHLWWQKIDNFADTKLHPLGNFFFQ
jgi:hypothetical protein